MTRKKDKKYRVPSICGTCAKPFDRMKATEAAREGRAFVHECGRVLVRGEMSAIPTSWDEADDMCPNCVTPWKCNGPHIASESTGDA